MSKTNLDETKKEAKRCCYQSDSSCCEGEIKEEAGCCDGDATKECCCEDDDSCCEDDSKEEAGCCDEDSKVIIKVLGTGCQNCINLEENVRKAVAIMEMEATIAKVTTMPEILAYGVMSTPTLVVNEVVKASGRVLNAKQIIKILRKI